jgi:two-component system sensor histidine kinase KdpD
VNGAKRSALSAARAAVVAAVTLSALTAAAYALGAPPITAGFIFLLSVLVLTLRLGTTGGVAAALLSTFALNYFFLPPIHTFSIGTAEHWIAFFTYGAAALLTGRLAARERERAAEAEAKRGEIAALYDLCFSLFAAGGAPGRLDELVARTLRAVGARSGALFLARGGEVLQAWPVDQELRDPVVVEAARTTIRSRTARRLGEPPGVIDVTPLGVGGRIEGALVTFGSDAEPEFLASAARLLALALERDLLLDDAARGAVAAESDRLKSTLLRAVSHDLRSPLTAMRLAIETLTRDAPDEATRRRIAPLAAEEERLSRRIDKLLAAARIEAGALVAKPEPIPPAELLQAAREHLAQALAGRRIELRVGADCPEAVVDAPLAIEVLVNLIENAARLSPPDEPLELIARGAPGGRVALEVLDRGPGVGDGAAPPASPGSLGLAIARQLASANRGELELANREGGGAVARFVVPAFDPGRGAIEAGA